MNCSSAGVSQSGQCARAAQLKKGDPSSPLSWGFSKHTVRPAATIMMAAARLQRASSSSRSQNVRDWDRPPLRPLRPCHHSCRLPVPRRQRLSCPARLLRACRQCCRPRSCSGRLVQCSWARWVRMGRFRPRTLQSPRSSAGLMPRTPHTQAEYPASTTWRGCRQGRKPSSARMPSGCGRFNRRSVHSIRRRTRCAVTHRRPAGLSSQKVCVSDCFRW